MSDIRPTRFGLTPGRVATTTTVSTDEPTSTIEPITTTSAPATASLLASDRLRDLLRELHDAGFVKVSDEPDGAATMDLGGLRLAIVSGGGVKLDNAEFVYPLLQRLGAGVDPATVAIEATPAGSTVERGRFVGPIRDDSSLRDRVSTVDDAEWFIGWAASVLALEDLDNGTVGHYGIGKGAHGLLPGVTP